MAEFRILSLDGGGSWALIQVRALTEIYTRVFDKPATRITGHEVLRRFDFIAANSGGTLTLAGLIKNWSLAELLDLFQKEEKRRAVFAKANIFDRLGDHIARLLGAGIGPKYSTKKKRKALEDILGDDGKRDLAALPAYVGRNHANRLPHFLFCALNYDSRRAAFMRSDGESRAASLAPHTPMTLVDAVHASANPPVNLFDLPAECGPADARGRFWDGAIAGHNNPVMAAVIEALANADAYATTRGEIKALSLGTGTTILPVKRRGLSAEEKVTHAEIDRPWLFADVKKLALAILGDPPDAATFHAHMLLDGPLPAAGATPGASPILRMNPLIQPLSNGDGTWRLPDGYDAQTFKALRDLDMDGISVDDVRVITTFCDRWIAGAVVNQPIRADGRTFLPEIGHRWFKDALAVAVREFA